MSVCLDFYLGVEIWVGYMHSIVVTDDKYGCYNKEINIGVSNRKVRLSGELLNQKYPQLKILLRIVIQVYYPVLS